MEYNARTAARYLIAIVNEQGIILNATQLQKILFIAYGHVLASKGEHLLDESPKAWPFGPVFPTVQKKVPVDRIIKVTDPDFDEIRKDTEVTQLFKNVVSKYSQHSASKLSAWSHKDGSPWARTVAQPGFV